MERPAEAAVGFGFVGRAVPCSTSPSMMWIARTTVPLRAGGSLGSLVERDLILVKRKLWMMQGSLTMGGGTVFGPLPWRRASMWQDPHGIQRGRGIESNRHGLRTDLR